MITLLALACFSGCGPYSESYNQTTNQPAEPGNLFNIPSQIIAEDSIRTIQFQKNGIPGSAPILNLNSNEQLQLQFEHLSIESRQFRVSLTHHNPDWSRSGLPPERYMNGFYSLPLNSGNVSRNNRPTYRQYSFTFPTEQFQITKSGNFLLKIEDSDTGYLVLNLPFFVYENEGTITSSVEQLQVPRQNLRRMHRPISQYQLPDFIDQPQFDLEFYYTQNRFWGRTKMANELDFSAPDHVQFEMSAEEAFIGDYEFRVLSLEELSQQEAQVIEAYPGETPPRLILRDDSQGFGASYQYNLSQIGPFGEPDLSLRAGYGNVVFRFEPHSAPDSTESIHLLGDFNNWSPGRNNQLRFNQTIGRWETNQIIKEGVYKYKYVLIDGNEIQDLFFDETFTDNRQLYHSFVYMRDPNEFYYRLLQVQSFFSE